MMEFVRAKLDNGWEFLISRQEEGVPKAALRAAAATVSQWSRAVARPQEAGAEHVPSRIVCVDCAVHNDRLGVYEVDDLPDGMGIASVLNSSFKRELGHIVRHAWTGLRWVTGYRAKPADDYLWLGEGISPREAVHVERLLVRADRGVSVPRELEDKAIHPVSLSGCKNYLIEMELGRRIRWCDEAAGVVKQEGYLMPAPPQPCVIKPMRGRGSMGVKVYLGDEQPPLVKKKGDVVSLRGLEGMVRAMRMAIVQPFIEPMRLPHAPELNAVYHLYFAHTGDAYQPLGGVWSASRSLIVKGGPKTVFGPLVLN